jgi:uracil-DNA glycosylase
VEHGASGGLQGLADVERRNRETVVEAGGGEHICGKIGYGVKSSTIKACSTLLERELALFPNARAYLLMGDVAIKAVNSISIRAGCGRATPAGSTYKIRGGESGLILAA